MPVKAQTPRGRYSSRAPPRPSCQVLGNRDDEKWACNHPAMAAILS
ncbi:MULTISPECIES: hypothetical protein [Bifidobacterium]|nr:MULTISPECIES: hypothetical protein [Bifidobacterium]MBI0086234.1 hypothetical protein [Bifidobacterium sp. M0404]MDT7507005.1 hypothetical protein [Bifidobacterium sp. H6bp22N]